MSLPPTCKQSATLSIKLPSFVLSCYEVGREPFYCANFSVQKLKKQNEFTTIVGCSCISPSGINSNVFDSTTIVTALFFVSPTFLVVIAMSDFLLSHMRRSSCSHCPLSVKLNGFLSNVTNERSLCMQCAVD